MKIPQWYSSRKSKYWVKTNEILRYEEKPEEFEDMFLSFPHL
jgi:hypothetical protein